MNQYQFLFILFIASLIIFEGIYFLFNNRKIFGILIIFISAFLIAITLLFNQYENKIRSKQQRVLITKSLFFAVIGIFVVILLLLLLDMRAWSFFLDFYAQRAQSRQQERFVEETARQLSPPPAAGSSITMNVSHEVFLSPDKKPPRLPAERLRTRTLTHSPLRSYSYSPGMRGSEQKRQESEEESPEPMSTPINIQTVGQIIISEKNQIAFIEICFVYLIHWKQIQKHKIWKQLSRLLATNMNKFFNVFCSKISLFHTNKSHHITRTINTDIIKNFYLLSNSKYDEKAVSVLERWLISIIIANLIVEVSYDAETTSYEGKFSFFELITNDFRRININTVIDDYYAEYNEATIPEYLRQIIHKILDDLSAQNKFIEVKEPQRMSIHLIGTKAEQMFNAYFRALNPQDYALVLKTCLSYFFI